MDRKLHWLMSLAFIAVLLAGGVIGLGALTRLTDAGLGCPDWPGCYGHLSVPNTQQATQQAAVSFPHTVFVAQKAWTEMIHRYFAGTLGLLVIVIVLLGFFAASKYGVSYLILSLLLLVMLIYQVVLGMWTVTLKLMPAIVASHLLVGMILLELLWVVYLKARSQTNPLMLDPKINKIKPFAIIGAILVFFQITLGAWTSTNYAAFSCPNFPFCVAHGAANYDFRHAFNLFAPMSNAARRSIYMLHRIGAFTVALYLLIMAVWLHIKMKVYYHLRKIIYGTLVLLMLQYTTGIINIFLLLPLPIAIAHNLIATLLLLCMVTFNFYIFSGREEVALMIKGAGKINGIKQMGLPK